MGGIRTYIILALVGWIALAVTVSEARAGSGLTTSQNAEFKRLVYQRNNLYGELRSLAKQAGSPASTAGAANNTIVWDSGDDIPLTPQLDGGLPQTVVRISPVDNFDSPTRAIGGNVDWTKTFQLGNFPPECGINAKRNER